MIEISSRATARTMNGAAPSGDMLSDLRACCASGDCEDSIRYVLFWYQPEFRFENSLATPEQKRKACQDIYFDSGEDFSDEDTAELCLVRHAARNFTK